MQGSPDLSVNKGNNHYWINSIYQGQVTTLGGFPVKANYAGKHKNKRWFFSKYGGENKISRSFEIDLSSNYPGQKIVIGSYKEFVRVNFHNADADTFGNSVGMLGEFASGKTLARDGITELNDYTKLGHEWQVLPKEYQQAYKKPGLLLPGGNPSSRRLGKKTSASLFIFIKVARGLAGLQIQCGLPSITILLRGFDGLYKLVRRSSPRVSSMTGCSPGYRIPDHCQYVCQRGRP
eukprot:scaffold3181_cov80-Cylindrotheca_fusiformis.AAC.2